MRKILLFLAVLVLLPTMAFAQLGVGPAAFFKSSVMIAEPIDFAGVNVNQFSFGGDVRYRVGWFQANGLVLYSVGDVDGLDIFLDAGVALDVAMVTLSLGAGPNYTVNFGETGAQKAGLNFKAGADIRLGPISVGASYIMALAAHTEAGIRVRTRSGLLGAQVLFWPGR